MQPWTAPRADRAALSCTPTTPATPVTDCPDPQAPKGTRLPLTAKYKGNVTARYAFDFQGWDSYFQAAGFFDGRRTSDLRLVEREIMGDIRATAPSISQPA